MNDEEKKARGRPRKYDTNAERKKAYRERKKEEQGKLETRAKRVTELQSRMDNMERKIVKSTYTDQQVPGEISEIHEHIKDRSRKYSPSELVDLDLHELKRIQDFLQSRYHGSYHNPLLSALESALMPSVDREFDSRKSSIENKPYEVILKEKLAKTADTSTPKTKMKPDEYIQNMKKTGKKITEEDLHVKPSTMEKKNIDSPKHWKYLKDIFRTDQLFEVFQELILLYTVEAELSRRERETAQERDFERLEKRLEELEKTMTDEKLRHVKEFVNKTKKVEKSEKNEKKTNKNANESKTVQKK
ncbi:MAG: hypothetical protein GOP50_10170 [Candidatus Heimdallarchaeota archaeon]|nr:hypothetical protein [Candidatus Heimdallarchaeota archaeon]